MINNSIKHKLENAEQFLMFHPIEIQLERREQYKIGIAIGFEYELV